MKRAQTLPLPEVKVGLPVIWRIGHKLFNRWQRGVIVEAPPTTFVKIRPRNKRYRAHWIDVRELRMEKQEEKVISQ